MLDEDETEIDDEDGNDEAVQDSNQAGGGQPLFAALQHKGQAEQQALDQFAARSARAELQADVGQADQEERKRRQALVNRREAQGMDGIRDQQNGNSGQGKKTALRLHKPCQSCHLCGESLIPNSGEPEKRPSSPHNWEPGGLFCAKARGGRS